MGLFNLARTIGSSVGISIVVTVLTRASQAEWNRLGGAINPYNPDLYGWLHLYGLSLSQQVALQELAGELARQSAIVTYVGGSGSFSFFAAAAAAVVAAPSRQRHDAKGIAKK